METIKSIILTIVPERGNNIVIPKFFSRITPLKKRSAKHNSKIITMIYQNQKTLSKMNAEKLTAVTATKPNNSNQSQQFGGIIDE